MKLKFITHSGQFHNDEILATAILKMAIANDNDNDIIDVVRTRDLSEYENDNDTTIYDVGGKYDGVKFFDHHQKDFSETFSEEYEIQMAAAGLIWKHFGMDLCSCKEVFDAVYRELIYPIDCQDNGKAIDSPPLFQVFGFNPSWEESGNKEIEDSLFMEAVGVVEKFLKISIERAESTARAKAFVEEFVNTSLEKGDKILLLERFVPYGKFLSGEEEFLLTVYPSQKEGCWRIQTLPDGSGDPFKSKIQLPESWTESLPEGMTFCHKGRFICEVTSQERAIELAREVIANT